MKKSTPASTVLGDAESHEWPGINKKQADKIMALLDEWADSCESKCYWYLDELNNAIPEHRETAAKLLESIATLRLHTDAIQSDGQTIWALLVLRAIRSALLRAKLDHDVDQFVKHDPIRATRAKQLLVAERRQWLKKLIEERAFTKADIEGSRLVRAELRNPYKKTWRKSDSTFREDLKSLVYKPR